MNAERIYEQLKTGLSDQLMDFEMREKAELAAEILELKAKRNAVILGHNYMEPALFMTIPDFKGDSLELSRKAAQTDKDVIVFCGVEFMAETAKLLNPNKTVLLPDRKIGCSLAAGIRAEDVRKIKKAYPGLPVITYINTYADVKAESDYCCTSGNAKAVVDHVRKEWGTDRIIFLPDEFLAKNIAGETGMDFVPIRQTLSGSIALPMAGNATGKGEVLHWDARCEVHEKFKVDDIAMVKAQYPDVLVLAHPECPPDVIKAADFSGSTSAMIKFVEQNKEGHKFSLFTECSMAGNIEGSTGADVLKLCSVRCPHMAQVTLENTRDALKYMQYEINVHEEIAAKARLSVERMLKIG